MRKGQVVKDAVTGKKFVLGKTGLKGLVKRVTEYAKTQDVDEVLVETTKTPVGQSFTMKCTKCGERFHISASKEAEKYNLFKEDCIAHARRCGVGAAIIPIR
jgi:hypothetical protein